MIAAVDYSILVLIFGTLVFLANRQVSMGNRVLLSLTLGTLYGIFVRFITPDEASSSIQSILHVVGYGYLSLLKMLVIPLILTSIIHAVLNLSSDSSLSLKKISLTTCGLLLGMTAISSLFGIFAAELFSVGQGMILPSISEAPAHAGYHGITDAILGMIPSNPVAMMTKENTVAVVIFSVLIGIAARSLDAVDHDKMHTFKELISSLFAIVKKLAQLVLSLTPYAIAALMALMFIKQGFALLTGVLSFFTAMYFAMLLVLLMHTVILMLFGYHPIEYFKNASQALLVAATTRSSFGTLPVTEEVLANKFKTNQVIASFTPSIGATMGMNACAGVYPAVLAIMALNIMHQPLTLTMVVSIMVINTIASLGISGIPGTAYVAATISLTSLNLPFAVIALVQGIDPIIDMGRTAVNINGSMTTALVNQRILGKELESTDLASEPSTS